MCRFSCYALCYVKKNIFGFWTVCHMKTRHSKIFSPSSAVYGPNNKSTDRENDCYLQPFSLTWIKNVATFNPKSYHFLNKSHTRSNQDGIMTSRTRRTCKVQICDNSENIRWRTGARCCPGSPVWDETSHRSQNSAGMTLRPPSPRRRSHGAPPHRSERRNTFMRDVK